MKAFGRDLSAKMRAYGSCITEQPLWLQQQINSSTASDMTIYQLMPIELHNTFLFKCVQQLMRQIDGYALKSFKYALFNVLTVEASYNFGKNFNDTISKVYEELGAGAYSEEKVYRKCKLTTEESISIVDSFESEFIKVAEEIEDMHDFGEEII